MALITELVFVKARIPVAVNPQVDSVMLSTCTSNGAGKGAGFC